MSLILNLYKLFVFGDSLATYLQEILPSHFETAHFIRIAVLIEYRVEHLRLIDEVWSGLVLIDRVERGLYDLKNLYKDI